MRKPAASIVEHGSEVTVYRVYPMGDPKLSSREPVCGWILLEGDIEVTLVPNSTELRPQSCGQLFKIVPTTSQALISIFDNVEEKPYENIHPYNEPRVVRLHKPVEGTEWYEDTA